MSGLSRSSSSTTKRVAMVFITACVAAFTTTTLAFADTPSVATIVSKMKAAMEPMRSSVRDMHITVRGSDGSSVEWTAEQARRVAKDGAAVLTVLTSPDGVRGNAFLLRDETGGRQGQWVYSPAVRRVRKLVYSSKGQAFLGTDLTYEDFGLSQSSNRTYTLLREESYRGTKAYVVREDPADKSVYSRIDVWIAADSFLPLKREYYDPAGLLWKVGEYADPTVIEGLPVVLKLSLKDVQEGGSTELTIHEIRVGAPLPPDLFDPDKLPRAVDSAFWQKR